jgi:hypothetical protein
MEVNNGSMKAVSIRQPLAHFIVSGTISVIDRNQSTKYRGPILIHASKDFDSNWQHPANPNDVRTPNSIDKLLDTGCLPLDIFFTSLFEKVRDYSCGGIVGIGEIADCVSQSTDVWFHGPYGLIFKNVRPLAFIKCKGAPGIFTVPDSVMTQLDLTGL